MKEAPIPLHEKERLATLYSLKILDTKPEKRFDQITKIATELFKVPISTLTLVDSRREWYKSCQGLNKREGSRAISFCGHTITNNKPLIINDARKDKRFRDNPLVISKPKIRFYAGIPIAGPDGRFVGAFCIKDHKPRTLSKSQIEDLKALASWAELELNSKELSRVLINLKYLRWKNNE